MIKKKKKAMFLCYNKITNYKTAIFTDTSILEHIRKNLLRELNIIVNINTRKTTLTMILL